MKITFQEKDPKKVIAKIKDAMSGRKLADLVSIDLEQEDLVVTISKLGTSTLRFAKQNSGDSIQFNLTSEKIAMTHKAFKDEVKAKIFKVIEQAGGVVVG